MNTLHWTRLCLVMVTLLIPVGLGWIGVHGKANPNTLLDHATKRTKVAPLEWSGWGGQTYTWLTNDSVFFMRDPFAPKAARKDLIAGDVTDLNNLTAFFNAHGGKRNRVIMSPDKKRFLWLAGALYCTNLTADHPVHWNLPDDSFLCADTWMPDSHHWVEFVRNAKTHRYTHILIHSLQPGQPARRVAILPTSPLYQKDADLSYAFVTPRGTLLMSGEDKKNRGIPTALTIYEIDLKGRGALRHQYRLPLPVLSGGDILDNEGCPIYSPKGDKVACQLSFANGRIVRQELWVWQINGQGGHSLGAIQETTKATPAGYDVDMTADEVQWLPDDKQIGFLCDQALWTVPSD